MPENEQPKTEPQTPAAGTPTPISPPAEWTAGPQSRFAGKTKEEILGIAEGLAVVAERFNQPIVQAPPVNRFDLDLPDDQYVDGRQVKQLLAQYANAPAPTDPRAAQAILGIVQMQRADEFKRWGGEIQGFIRGMALEHWTLDNLNMAVDIVKSRHIDDLAAEKAQRIINESHPTIRSGSGGSGGVLHTQQRTLADASLPKTWVDQARARGIDESVVREFAAMQGTTPEEYLAEVEKYGKGAVIRG